MRRSALGRKAPLPQRIEVLVHALECPGDGVLGGRMDIA